MKTLLTTDTIIDVYRLKQMGAKWDEIKEKTKVSNPTNVYDRITHFLKMSTLPTNKYQRNYVAAVEKLRVQSPQSTPQPKVILDRFDKLNLALTKFQEDVESFLEEEISLRVGQIQKENKELVVEKARLMKNVSDLETALDTAKRSNWSTNLRKRFQNGHSHTANID